MQTSPIFLQPAVSPLLSDQLRCIADDPQIHVSSRSHKQNLVIHNLSGMNVSRYILHHVPQMLARGQIKETRDTRELLGTMREEAVQARKKCDKALQEVAQALLTNAQVVCSTCTGAGDYALKDR